MSYRRTKIITRLINIVITGLINSKAYITIGGKTSRDGYGTGNTNNT